MPDMKGFLVRDYADRFEEGTRELARLLKEKKLKYTEDVVEGLENAPKAFIGLFRGENLGKQIVKVAVTRDNTVPPYGTGF